MEKIYCAHCNNELDSKKGKNNNLWMMQYECPKCWKKSVKTYGIWIIIFLVIILIVNIWLLIIRWWQWEDNSIHLYAIIVCISIIAYNYFFTKKIIYNNKTQ